MSHTHSTATTALMCGNVAAGVVAGITQQDVAFIISTVMALITAAEKVREWLRAKKRDQ